MSNTQDDRRREEAERQFFARYYAEQAYHPVGWRLRLERDARLLRGAAPGGRLGRVLSVGCGDGQFELAIAPYAEHVVGVDLSPEAIAVAERARAARSVPNVEFRCQALADLAWSESFDTVVCLAFLHHVPEVALPGFLDTIRRHLRPGGIFYAQDPNVNGVLRSIGRVVMGARYGTYHTPDERELDPDELCAALRAAGFATLDVRYVDLTLIPGLYVWKRGAAWPMHLAALVDRVFCASPFARWASGFAVIARA
ncbi:MAG TPA: methyltransferase domain-containing protein [Myxococcota bacterium]|jgi:2-polyprenyl-3-methyl-5-hydroxy-6-metoxy-1,4-benzoquinol methylase|nr:methyltransferase domain-containing protein [Myxococcota bacterium]